MITSDNTFFQEKSQKFMTNNPFFSGRIPQELHNAIEHYRRETQLSKTQILIEALSQYIGYEQKKNETNVPPIQQKLTDIFNRLENLEREVNYLKMKNDNNEITTDNNEITNDNNEITTLLVVSSKILARRLKVKPSTISSAKSRKTKKDFYLWSKGHDFDGIGWIAEEESNPGCYIPQDELSEQAQNKLIDWLEQNPN